MPERETLSLGRTIFIVYSCIQPAFIEVMFFLCTLPGTEFGVGHVSGKKINKAHCLKDFTSLRMGEYKEAIM